MLCKSYITVWGCIMVKAAGNTTMLRARAGDVGAQRVMVPLEGVVLGTSLRLGWSSCAPLTIIIMVC